jgi:hypothetical protein
MDTNRGIALVGLALAVVLAGCGQAATPAPEPAPAATTAPAGKTYTDPGAIRAKVETAGVTLKSCGEPFYDAAGSLTIRCFTAATPSEQVALATFEKAPSGVETARLLTANSNMTVHSGDGWLVGATTAATAEKMRAAVG